MNRSQICEQNSQHFPDDATWQKHCQMVAAYRAAQLEVKGLAPRVAGKLERVAVVGRAV
jgi:hypothetical protein